MKDQIRIENNNNFIGSLSYDDLEERTFSTDTPDSISKQNLNVLKWLKTIIPNDEYRRFSLNRSKCIFIKSNGSVVYSEAQLYY